MSFFCDWLPMLLPTFFIGCAMFRPATGAQGSCPEDFWVELHWRAGSLPPPLHYESTITITSSGQSKMVLTPDYRRAGVPEWTEQFHVEEPNVRNLYRVMVENGLFTHRWRKMATGPTGGGYRRLVVIASGKRFMVEDYVVSEHRASARVMYAAVQALVPKNLWEQLEARREQYIEEYPRR